MSGKSDDGWYHGEFENLARRFSAPVTDCSGWESDLPADQWTVGEFKNLAQRISVPVTDCSDWDREPVAWLELRGPADPAAVAAATARLVRAADAAAPELGLTLDPTRSGVEGGEVVVALTPTRPVGGADRLAEITRTLAASQVRAVWRRAG